jgi:mannose-6-phosphate isomerase class I
MSDATATTEEKKDHREILVFINDRPHHFESDDVTGRQIKEKAEIPDDQFLYLRHEGADKLIRNDQHVELHEGEHLVATAEPRGVEVFVDGKAFRFESDDVTGRQIKEKAQIPDNYSLYLRQEGSNEPIADDERVELHHGEHFFSRPPSNVS